MKENSKALLNFMRRGIAMAIFLDITSTVISGLKGNGLFSSLAGMVTELETKYADLKKASDIGKVGSLSEKRIAAVLKYQLQDFLKIVCDNVNLIAAGNRAALLTSGFKVSKNFRTPTVLGAIENFKVVQGKNAGELTASFTKNKNAKGIVYEYNLDEIVTGASLWNAINCGSDTCTISGLVPGTKINIRASVSGVRNQLVYSEVVTKIVGYGI